MTVQDAPRIWIDGREADAVSALDRGLHYGDGLFETLAWTGQCVRFGSLHLARLAAGCERFGIPAPGAATLESEFRVAGGRLPTLLKLIVTRGRGGRGYAPPSSCVPTRILLAYPWPEDPPAWSRDGVVVEWSRVPVATNPLLAGLKHLNRLEQVLARQQLADDNAQGRGEAAQEALMATESGHVICGTMTNVFAVRDNELLTPALDRAGVAGVMRAVVLREAARMGIAARVQPLARAEIDACDELFLTNARIGVRPVRSMGGRTLAVGAVTRRLQQRLAELVD